MALAAKGRLDLGPLHQILLKACPPTKTGAAGSIQSTLAPALEVTHQYIYRWIEEGRVPAKFVKKIVEASNDRVTVEELVPYVIS